MIRNLVDKPFAEGVKYLEAAGLSTDTKPTEGLITGSRFTEVDTGNVFAFDEASGAWKKIVSGPATT